MPDTVDGVHAVAFARAIHGHDSDYYKKAAADVIFAAINHGHAGDYASLGHDHDRSYSVLAHGHPSPIFPKIWPMATMTLCIKQVSDFS